MRHLITDTQDALDYMFAGHAVFTLVSQKTGDRYTYKVSVPKKPSARPIWFASVLQGATYAYMGKVQDNKFSFTRASRMDRNDPAVQGFAWLLNMLARGANIYNGQAEFWHEGHCGRCGRALTVPESLTDGIGPECRKIIAKAA